ncbi:hypothetical protein Dsin_018992 [Dipteronia sinensis]|uniref:Uncharacterized protein n=1 Tax=Dipteronia sinensis TaxID=43782 RepID=A0AAE0A7V5_9ROSI|nr:hypothetical protein Dsin_018992 [Dipteronia sinensis]
MSQCEVFIVNFLIFFFTFNSLENIHCLELGVIHCYFDIWQGYLDHCGRKVKPGPFDRIWYSESQKALYLQKLNQVKVDKLTNLGMLLPLVLYCSIFIHNFKEIWKNIAYFMYLSQVHCSVIIERHI